MEIIPPLNKLIKKDISRSKNCMKQHQNIFIDDSIETEDGAIISPSDSVKYLGMYIDTKLNFKYHINIVISKISKMIGNFWRATGLDIKAKKIIYHSLVESHLNYSRI